MDSFHAEKRGLFGRDKEVGGHMGKRGWLTPTSIGLALGMVISMALGATIYVLMFVNSSLCISSEMLVDVKQSQVDTGLKAMGVPDSKTERVNMIVSSSHTRPCVHTQGDHLLAKSLKNKMDYASKHDMSIFYNLAHIDTNFSTWWPKQPLFKKLLPAHPEVEWFLWMDSDAFITDMSWDIPYEKYEGYNMVVPGWPCAHERIKPNWTCINAGIFLLRRCDWSLQLLDTWLDFAREENAEKYSKLIDEEMAGRDGRAPCDQSSLFYLMRREPERFGKHIYIEQEYALSGHWLGLIDTYNDTLTYAGFGFPWPQRQKPPFVTHFAGCSMCGPGKNLPQPQELCFKFMEQAFNFADNQVIAPYGLQHVNLSSPVLEMIPVLSTKT